MSKTDKAKQEQIELSEIVKTLRSETSDTVPRPVGKYRK